MNTDAFLLTLCFLAMCANIVWFDKETTFYNMLIEIVVCAVCLVRLIRS